MGCLADLATSRNLKRTLIVCDLASVVFCIAFTLCTWFSPIGVLLTKPVPVFLSGACGCALLYIYMLNTNDSISKLTSFTSAALPACIFALYALGDCTTEIGDYKTADGWVTFGGVMFACGQLGFVAYAVAYSTRTESSTCFVLCKNFRLSPTHAIISSVAVVLALCDVGLLAFTCYAMNGMSVYVAIYLAQQAVQCVVFALVFHDSGSPCLVLLFVGGVVVFSISDVLMFAVDYGYTSMSLEAGSAVTMWLYWCSCAMVALGCRVLAFEVIEPRPRDDPLN